MACYRLLRTDGHRRLLRGGGRIGLQDVYKRRIAQLERVREAATAYVRRIEAEAAAVEPWNAPEMDSGIYAAVVALSESKDG